MRFTKLTEVKKLEWIYRNSRVEFKLYAKRGEGKTFTEYLWLTEDFGSLKTETPQDLPEHTAHRNAQHQTRNYWGPLLPTQSLDRGVTWSFDMRNRCSRCIMMGHIARGCNNQPRLFSWVCGQDGRCTIHCCRRNDTPGNERGRREQTGPGHRPATHNNNRIQWSASTCTPEPEQ